jgi:hypothetical protein
VYTNQEEMNGQFAKAPAPTRPVHVKLPKPNVVDQELTDEYFKYLCTATFTGM